MDLNGTHAILALAPQPTPGTARNPGADTFFSVSMLLLMGVMLYFVIWRPQQKKARDHARLLKELKPGDKVITSGGIIGIVITVKEKTVSIRSADAKLEVAKSAVAEITERSGEASES